MEDVRHRVGELELALAISDPMTHLRGLLERMVEEPDAWASPDKVTREGTLALAALDAHERDMDRRLRAVLGPS